MRLLVDVGNTQVKYVTQGAGISTPFSALVYIDYQLFIEQLRKGLFANITEVILANVHGNEILDAIEKWTRQHSIAFIQVHSEAKAFGIRSSYQQPERLGVDRWLAMIGAKQLYPDKNLLIIDAGTATTVDLLNADGQHCGGWIMPGVQTMFNSLLSGTKKIIATANVTASLRFGKDSSNCLNNGSWAMTIGAIKEAILQANNSLTLDKVLITGGNSQNIIDLLAADCQLEPALVFHGLSCFRAR